MTRPLALLLLGLAACDDTLFLPHAEVPVEGEGWCAVRAVLASCASCHSAAGAAGGLDLETDAFAALFDGASASGAPVVVAGDPEGSLLFRKVAGTQGPAEGGIMPPGAPLDADTLERIRAWIADGATDVCDTSSTPTGVGFHPPGWSDPGVHGLSAKFQELECLSCHGEDLTGGVSGVACASCHDATVPDWSESCTFCHGDRAAAPEPLLRWEAAPPEGIDDGDDPFVHDLHLGGSALHGDWGCETCHVVPDSAFSPGHLFVGDDTPERAEVVLSPPRPGGTFAGGTCSNVYCHGDGRSPGTVSVGDPVDCGDCHRVDGAGLSGPHEDHVDEGIACAECHPTVDAARQVVQRDLHVNGVADVALPPGVTRTATSPSTCTGTCHGEAHNGRRWVD